MSTPDSPSIDLEFHVYDFDEPLPLPLYYQVMAFSRIVWGENPDVNTADDNQVRSECNFVFARDDLLIAHTALLSITLDFNGESYRCGGLAGVMTYPAFRKRGYGRRLVTAATDMILNSGDYDIGLLWTADHNLPFYAHLGWENLPGLTTTYGDPPRAYASENRLMVFASDKGRAARDAFASGTLHVGDKPW